MAKAPQVKIDIAATDQYSATMARLRSELGKIEAPLRKMLAAQQSQSDAVLGSFGSAFEAAQQKAQGLRSVLTSFAPSLAAVASVGTVGGIAAMTKDFMQAGLGLRNTAAMAGVTVNRMNDLQGAARGFGLNAGDADAAMVGLNRSISDAVYGKNNNAANIFNRFGIDIGSVAKGAKSAGEVLPGVVSMLTAAYKKDPNAARDLASIFNMPEASLPMFVRGTDELERRAAAAAKLNRMTPESIAAAEKVAESYGNMQTAGQGLADVVMTRLSPGITKQLTGLTEWVEASTRTEDGIKRVTAAAEGLAGTALFTLIFGRGAAAAVLGKLVTGAGGALTLPLTLSGDSSAGANPGGFLPGFVPNNSDDASMGARFSRWWGGMFPGGGSAPNGVPVPGGFGASGPPIPLKAGEQTRNAEAMRAVFEKAGWTPEAASAFIGSGIQESGLNPSTVNSTGHSGIPQWDQARRAWVESRAQKPVTSMSAGEQAEWMRREVDENPRFAGLKAKVRTSRDLADLNAAVTTQYEVPGNYGTEIPNRLRLSKGVHAVRPDKPAEVPDTTRGGLVRPPAGEDPAATRGGRIPPQYLVPGAGVAPTAAGGGVGQNSTVRIDINHTNAPDGTILNASTDGLGVEMGKLRVGRAMPQQDWSRGY